MSEIAKVLADIVGTDHVLSGGEVPPDYAHDEALLGEHHVPAHVVRPGGPEEVADVLRAATERRVPVTARGSGTGLSGACVPRPDGICVSFERMNAVLEVDADNHVAVVQPGVTLADLEERTAAAGLMYSVYPGELSGSLGGNVGTNAGGMRAVRYGVTRHNVLGLQAAMATGELIRTGGKFVKASTGYDLTQLIIGSEGTLALATEVTVKLHPRPAHAATVLAPFDSLDQVIRAVPAIIGSGLAPQILEYIDALSLAGITDAAKLSLGVSDPIRERALAYLVVVVEGRDEERLTADVEFLGELLGGLEALEVYVLDATAGRRLIEAREKAFWVMKAIGGDEVVDVVVPRRAIGELLARGHELAEQTGSLVVGCGHAGDGNVHLGVLQKDPEKLSRVLRGLFEAGIALGGAISGEHGVGRAKTRYFLELEDPVKIGLMRRIKEAFDPAGVLNPGVLFGEEGTLP